MPAALQAQVFHLFWDLTVNPPPTGYSRGGATEVIVWARIWTQKLSVIVLTTWHHHLLLQHCSTDIANNFCKLNEQICSFFSVFCTHTHAFPCTHAYTHTDKCACIHAHTHTHACTNSTCKRTVNQFNCLKCSRQTSYEYYECCEITVTKGLAVCLSCVVLSWLIRY